MNHRDDRGQTTIDYTFGVSLFLFSVIFVFLFIQPLVAPFTGGQADVLRSDRVADSLTEDMLLESTDPTVFVLDERCTLYFFEKMQGSPSAPYPPDCRYPDSVGDFKELVAIEDTKYINVTVENSFNSPGIITKTNEVGTDVRLAIGDSPPAKGDVTVAQRHVYLDGEEYRLYVRIWGASIGGN